MQLVAALAQAVTAADMVEVSRLTGLYLQIRQPWDSVGFDHEKSRPDRLVFRVTYQHMNGWGKFDGTGEYEVGITPSLADGFTVRVFGVDRDQAKRRVTEHFTTKLRLNIPAMRLLDNTVPRQA